MSEPLVYLRGEWTPASRASLAIYDAGVVMGATVTEMTRTFRLKPFGLDRHLERLFRSLKYTRFDIGMTRDQLAEISLELLAHNGKLLPPGGELGLIHFVTAGEFATYAGMAGRGASMKPTLCAHTFPLPFEMWAGKMRSGAHVVTPSIRHVPPQCIDPKMKYRSRMHYYLADQEAKLADPEAIALLLDLDGNITETSGANFLFVEGGSIVTPTTRNTLPGVSRAVTRELAKGLGIDWIESDRQPFDVINASEAFLASTPYCLLPVTKINGLTIGEGKPGPVFRRLMAAWSERVGLDVERQVLGESV